MNMSILQTRIYEHVYSPDQNIMARLNDGESYHVTDDIKCINRYKMN